MTTPIVPSKPLLNDTTTQAEKISEVDDALNEAINSLQFHDSLLSKYASLFNTMPWWIKLIIGTCISLLVVLGFAVHVGVLAGISIMVELMFVASWIVAADHQQNYHSNIDAARSRIRQLGTLLEQHIDLIHELRTRLSDTVKQIEQENQNLSNRTLDFQTQIKNLNRLNKKLMDEKNELERIVTQLRINSTNLMTEIENHKNQLDKIHATKLSLEHDKDQLLCQITSLYAEQAASIYEQKTLQSTITDLEGKIINLFTQCTTNQDHNKRNTAEAHAKLNLCGQQIGAYNKELDTADSSLGECVNTVKSLKSQNDKIKQVNTILRGVVQPAPGQYPRFIDSQKIGPPTNSDGGNHTSSPK